MGHFGSRRAAGLAAVALVWPACSGAQESAGEEVTWVERPSAGDLQRLGPPEARRNGVDGRATIECGVTRYGRLQGCVLKRETPAGMGFGEAALQVAPLYRLEAKSDDVDLSGSRIAFAVRFQFSAVSAPAITTSLPSQAIPDAIAQLTPPAGRMMRLGVVPNWQVDFLDLDRLTYRGDDVDVVRLTVYSEKSEVGERSGQYDVWGLRFDCRNNSYTVLGARTFNRAGAAVAWEPGGAAPQPIPEGSVYDVIADIACRRGAPASLDAESTPGALDAARRILGAP